MISNIYYLDNSGNWLPENWSKDPKNLDGRGIPLYRGGLYGVKWTGDGGVFEIVKDYKVFAYPSRDLKVMILMNSNGKGNGYKEINIYDEFGVELVCLNVPVFDGVCCQTPTFLSVYIKEYGKDGEVQFNDGNGDYIATLTPDFRIINWEPMKY